MPEIYTWSDITAFWRCPRAWAYQRMGWRPLELPDPLVLGSLIHEGASAHYLFRDSVVAKTPQEERLLPKARSLTERYIAKYGDLKVSAADHLFFVTQGSEEGKAVGGHPDLVGTHNRRSVLVELKTGASPEIATLDMSGQRDFYALVVEEAGMPAIDLVYLDIISEDYITRVERPPRRASAEYTLASLLQLQGWTLKEALATPHFLWDCNRCWFYKACAAREQGGNDRAVLEGQYVQGEARS